MSAILKFSELINVHKDVVTLYYSRAASLFVIAGVQRTNGDTVVIDTTGRGLGFYLSKCEALASINE